MGKVTKLSVVTPTVSQLTRESMIKVLEDTLEEAKKGDISEILMLIQHADPHEWSDRMSFSSHIPIWIGRLELTKLDLAAKYKELDEHEEPR